MGPVGLFAEPGRGPGVTLDHRVARIPVHAQASRAQAPMSVLTTGEPGTPERPLTVDDLGHTPDDGRRYELVDGRLDVSPAPGSIRMRVANRLSTHLNILCGGEVPGCGHGQW